MKEEEEYEIYTVINEELDLNKLLKYNIEIASLQSNKMSYCHDVETIGRKLNNIMYSTCYCGLCIEIDDGLTSIYTPFEIGSVGSTSAYDMLAEVFHDTAELLASYYICNQCLEKIIQSYIFIKSSKKSAKIMSEYVNSFESKVITLEEQIDENLDYSETKFVLLIEPNEEYTMDNVNINYKEEGNYDKESFDEHTNVTDEETDEIFQTTRKSPKNNVPLSMLPDPIPYKTIYLEDEKVTPIKTKNKAFKCNICDVVMITFKDWKKHENAYHKTDENVPMTCQICNKTIANKRCLIQHYKRHNRAKCRNCSAVIPNTYLKSHMRDEHDVEIKELMYEDFEIIDENQCEMCFKHFNNHEQLKAHSCRFKCTECSELVCIHYKYLISFRQQALNKSTKFLCPDCDYMCVKKDHLVGHANRVHLDHHYECELCGTGYYSKSALKFHISSAHVQQYICEYCDDEFKEEYDYKIHIQLCKNERRDIKCWFTECKASFDTQEELSKHEDLKHKMFPCGMCSKTFKAEHKQREHTTKTHGGLQRLKKNSPNHQCPICDKRFDLRGEYTRHVTTHGPIYNCKVCQEQFDDRGMFLRHYLRRHKLRHMRQQNAAKQNTVKSDKLILICDSCGKVCSSRQLFSAHRRTHMEPVCCTICNKMVKSISIYSHMRCHKEQSGLVKKREYRPDRKFKCDQCDFAAVNRQQMETHINRVHLKIKPYVCSMCGVAYCSKFQLREHVNNNHVEEKWHKCELCAKVIRSKIGLKKHMMKHTGEKPHVCEVCGQGFITVTLLLEHSKRHTEGKQTVCPICESQFFSLRHLRLHIKRVHWKRKNRTFNHKLVKGLEGHEYIFHDRRHAIVDEQ